MRLVTGLCLVAGLAVAGEQVAVNGWASFISRPAGVGASDSALPGAAGASSGSDVAAAPAPTPAADALPTSSDPPSVDAPSSAASPPPAVLVPAPAPAPSPPVPVRRRTGRPVPARQPDARRRSS